MSGQVATLEQRVKERVQETIANLIPDDELARLVEAQVQHFRANKLQELIQNAIRDKFSEAIRAEFSKPEWAPTWSQFGGVGASEAVKQIIEQSAGAILSNIIGSAVHMTLSQMQRHF